MGGSNFFVGDPNFISKKMKKFILFVALAGLISCSKDRISGSGPVTTETRSVPAFTSVSASGSSNVFITQGATFDVKVKAFSNLLPYLETKAENGILLIAYKSNSNVTNDNSEIYITMPVLSGVSTSGSGNVNSAGSFPLMDNFLASISGSGNITLKNSLANNYTLRISGSGNVKSFGLLTQNADVSIEGSGNAEVNVAQHLKASIKGSGNVVYQGSPEIDSNIAGSGKIIKQ